jgi:hypothetical protein
MQTKILVTAAIVLAVGAAVSGVSAQGTMHHGMKMTHGAKMVAYDAKDKRYYSVAYAKSHGMHDKGGDPLTIVAMSSLPKDAKESKAMHGAKM